MRTNVFVVTALVALVGFVVALPRIETLNQIDTRGLIEDKINETLNDVLANLSDTISIDAISINFGDLVEDSKVISGALEITNLKVIGVKSLVAKAIALNIFTQQLSLEVDINEIIVSFSYSADVVALELVPLYGEGRISILLDDADLTVDSKANLSGGISLANTVVGVHFGETHFDLTGLINNPEFSALVSAALNDNFSDFVNNNSGLVTKIISPIIEIVANVILGDIVDGRDINELQELFLEATS